MLFEKLIPQVDVVLRTLFAPATTTRSYPDAGLEEGELTAAEKQHALGLMRVNHVGEVCAQALYQGQAITARDKTNREALQHAAYEEVEHLAWTEPVWLCTGAAGRTAVCLGVGGQCRCGHGHPCAGYGHRQWAG